jgi:pimeloyl-ACP methyl ester carboxylesterase
VVLIYFNQQSLNRERSSLEELAPTSGKFVQLESIKLFYQDLGPIDGLPVVLMHGTGSWSEIWRETIDILADNGFRAIALDLPPFGFSGKPLGVGEYTTEKQGARINALLDSLGIETAFFVGHSVGARATVEAALSFPSRVKKLILIDAALGFSSDSSQEGFVQNYPGVLMKQVFNAKSTRNAIFRTLGTNPSMTKPFFESFVSNKAAVTPARIKMLQIPLGLVNYSEASADWFEYLLVKNPHQGLSSNFNNFQSFTAPVAIIWGDKDDVTPLWQGKALAELFPLVKLEVLKDTGHIPYIEDTEAFNDALLRILSDSVR